MPSCPCHTQITTPVDAVNLAVPFVHQGVQHARQRFLNLVPHPCSVPGMPQAVHEDSPALHVPRPGEQALPSLPCCILSTQIPWCRVPTVLRGCMEGVCLQPGSVLPLRQPRPLPVPAAPGPSNCDPLSCLSVQLLATVIAACVNLGTAWWQLSTIPHICDIQNLPPGSPWTCPGAHVFFDASVIWGLIGPARIFGAEVRHKPGNRLLSPGSGSGTHHCLCHWLWYWHGLLWEGPR